MYPKANRSRISYLLCIPINNGELFIKCIRARINISVLDASVVLFIRVFIYTSELRQGNFAFLTLSAPWAVMFTFAL